jgi:uncharacterized protein
MLGNIPTLHRDDAIALLRDRRAALSAFQVKSLFLFGSVARNEANPSSDVDLLVEFEKPIGMFTFARLQRYLEALFGRAVDLGTPDSLKPFLSEIVLKEAIRVF